MKLATDLTKEGPTYLPKRAEGFRTVRDLLESGLFRKDARQQSQYQIYIVVEKEDEEQYLSEEESLRTTEEKNKTEDKKSLRTTKDKKSLRTTENKAAKSGIEPVIKTEPKVKQEVTTPVRKRGYSRVSPTSPLQQIKDDESSEDLPSIDQLYSLRNRKRKQ